MQDITEIYNKYGKMLYKYIFCLTGNKDISEEIVQETFLVAVKDINKFKGNCKISTWLCQISKYIWYKKLKKENLKKEIPLDIVENSLFADESIEEMICAKENKMQFFKKLQTFLFFNTKFTGQNWHKFPWRRSARRAHTVCRANRQKGGNFEYSEIAEIMNKTSNWARVVFFRGKQKLKEEFDK